MSAALGDLTRARRRVAPGSTGLLLVGVALAVGARAWIGHPAPAASVPAALLFSGVLLALFAMAPRGLGRVTWRGVGLGLAGGVALVAVSLVGLPGFGTGARTAASTLWWWVPLIMVVVAAEEVVLRGVLFTAIATRHGDLVAIAATALVFALMHLPMYGGAALPVDLCVGVVLGSLRVASGGITAPLAAHLTADLATAWLP
jgi:membrane protease YdiL (CAAX protease family)